MPTNKFVNTDISWGVVCIIQAPVDFDIFYGGVNVEDVLSTNKLYSLYISCINILCIKVHSCIIQSLVDFDIFYGGVNIENVLSTNKLE